MYLPKDDSALNLYYLSFLYVFSVINMNNQTILKSELLNSIIAI